MGLNIQLLGPPRILVDGGPLDVDTRKAVALLAYLAVTARAHSRDHLVELLWPDQPDEKGRGSLRRTLSVLNSALGGRWMEVDRSAVRIGGGFDLDVERFSALIGERSDDPDERVRQLQEAAALWGGGFMQGFGLRGASGFEHWQSSQDESLRQQTSRALDELSHLLLEGGDVAEAEDAARRWLAIDPLNEPAYRVLIEASARSGDRAAAVKHYRDLVSMLSSELGVQPLEETRSLYEAVKEGESFRPPAAASAGSGERPLPLVARESEAASVLQSLRENKVVVIEGEAGIGKTKLVEHVIGSLGAAAVGHASPGEAAVTYGTVTRLMRAVIDARSDLALPSGVAAELGRLLPGLAKGPVPRPIDSPGARSRFFEAIVQTLRMAEVAVVLEDLHWADEASIQLLTHLISGADALPVNMVLTWRSDELPSGSPLLAAVRRAEAKGDLVRIRLRRFDREQTRRLVAGFDDGRFASMAGDLHMQGDGLPLFLIEYLKQLAASGGEDIGVPAGVKELLSSRLAKLNEIEKQLAAVVAIAGRAVGAGLVRDASGRTDEEVATGLDSLLRAGVLKPADGAFDLSHERLRSVVIEETGLGRRTILHRRLARALMKRDRSSARAAEIADHLEQASEDEEALTFRRAAAMRAMALYANAEAIRHLESLLAREPDAELQEMRADLLVLEGDYAGAADAFEALSAEVAPPAARRLSHKLAQIEMRRGDWAAASGRLQDLLRSDLDDGLRARASADLSLVEHRLGRSEEALRLGNEALDAASRSGDAAAIAQANNLLGILASEPSDAERYFGRSLEAAQELGDLAAVGGAHNNLGLVLKAQGRMDEAESHARAALDAFVKIGDRHKQAAVRNNLADLLHSAGRRDESMEMLKAATALFAEIGGTVEPEPEIWKLVNW